MPRRHWACKELKYTPYKSGITTTMISAIKTGARNNQKNRPFLPNFLFIIASYCFFKNKVLTS